MSDSFFNHSAINASIKNHIARNLAFLKKIKFAYGIMNKLNPAELAIVTNSSRWFRFYRENNFQFIDPVLLIARRRLSPFSWDETTLLTEGVKTLRFSELAKCNNIVHGFVFVLHDQHNNLAVLSLIIDDECDIDVAECIQKNQNSLQMLLISTHEKTLTLYKKINKQTEFNNMIGKELFSKRENEVVYWASIGKSYQEIALILGIKLTTVKYHMANVVRKLGVSNARHAIRLGIELGVIRPVIINEI